ncbi:hypothetical protein T552_00073 [Pneumocystis carinii B80]|uniref:RCC1-like domain-containing protein n=1 Tax=Pneumocystis carinii (strain B80) TaxID=1408658 RepID=A0A0W4ZSU0_PNEC8|nr:hypothetical protein T552_00073 [Pneumocystis carinii B80]KTW31429.1 hypothetical protein T552_00073 [Pneumocystis carinii B80]
MLFGFGTNTYGQLGVSESSDIRSPTPIYEISPSIVSAGGRHTLFLSENGELFVAGNNSFSQCCTSSKIDGFIRATEQRWIFVAAGWEFSVLATEDSVWTCGRGERGELGLGQGIYLTELRQIPDFPPIGRKIVDIKAGIYHVVCLLENGECWGWGDTKYGQLGPGKCEYVFSPRRMNISGDVQAIACGRGFTATLTRRLDIWGRLRGWKKDDLPQISIDQVKAMYASWSGLYFLMQDGKVVSIGCNDYGQQCPEFLPRLSKLAVGSEHCLGLGIDGKVYGWGWNEHGNIKEDQDDVREAYQIKILGKVTFVAAGCGTSWIYVEKAELSENS